MDIQPIKISTTLNIKLTEDERDWLVSLVGKMQRNMEKDAYNYASDIIRKLEGKHHGRL